VASDTPTTDLPESVSREAHQRMTDERNQARAENEQLKATILELGLSDKARRHFTAKGVEDPDWAAEIALPSLKGVAGDVDVAEYLDQKFARLYPKGSAEPGEVPPTDQVPTAEPDAAEPPGFARPSPSSEGAPPGQKKYTIRDPEIQQLIRNNDRDALARLDKAGQIDWLAAAPGVPG